MSTYDSIGNSSVIGKENTQRIKTLT